MYHGQGRVRNSPIIETPYEIWRIVSRRAGCGSQRFLPPCPHLGGPVMRLVIIFVVLACLSAPQIASAQEWTEYESKEGGFAVNFPGQPRVTQTTYKSEYGYMLPARVYTAERGSERYSVTVVDYSGIEMKGLERAKKCPPGAEPCIGSMNTGPGYWKMDVGGAVVYATWQFMQRNARVTHLMWNFIDLVEGQQLQLTNNADK